MTKPWMLHQYTNCVTTDGNVKVLFDSYKMCQCMTASTKLFSTLHGQSCESHISAVSNVGQSVGAGVYVSVMLTGWGPADLE